MFLKLSPPARNLNSTTNVISHRPTDYAVTTCVCILQSSHLLQTQTKNKFVVQPRDLLYFAQGTGIYSSIQHRRRIKTKEKAKVVAPAWGRAVSVNLFAALVILHQDDVKNRMNCTRMIIFFKSS